LISTKINDKPTDKNPDKKNAVLNLSKITTFFHILYCNFTYPSNGSTIVPTLRNKHFQICLRFIEYVQNRKHGGVIADTDMVFVLRFQKIRAVGQNL
jgi:hypothetical protein